MPFHFFDLNKFLSFTLYRETETTIQAATFSQEIGTGGILKINTK